MPSSCFTFFIKTKGNPNRLYGIKKGTACAIPLYKSTAERVSSTLTLSFFINGFLDSEMNTNCFSLLLPTKQPGKCWTARVETKKKKNHCNDATRDLQIGYQ
jgi:hypothetical protein